MSKINIYRASAGSGKTFTLTGEYIKILFKNHLNYKHTLAVTFTNKATAEMKGRILKKLHELAHKDNPDYLSDIMQENGINEKEVRNRAKLLLKLILHDFSNFTISTIDSFFQKVIRSFARETGLQGGFKIELDLDSTMQKAVDLLIMEMESNDSKELKKWLISFASEKIESGKSWNLSNDIQKLGREVFKEEFQTINKQLIEKLNNKNFLNTYIHQLNEIIDSVKSAFEQIHKDAFVILQSKQLELTDFSGKSRTPLNYFKKISGGKTSEYFNISAIEKLIGNPDKWERKDNTPSKNDLIRDAYPDLNTLLNKAIELTNQFQLTFQSASEIKSNLFALGITTDIAKKIMDICQDKNIFLLADSSRLLNQIIDNNDAPFIYEKTGSRYDNFMIDEFQDTSKLQWANFKPLIENSLSSNQKSLLVGDVKQSIYRWRNSDWKLLAETVEQDLANFGSTPKTLDTNWRSSENVINYNNSIFTNAASTLQNLFNNELPDHVDDTIRNFYTQKIAKAYFDVNQAIPPHKQNGKGHVFYRFLDADNKEEYNKNAISNTIEQISILLDKGYAYKDICILVRRKSEGQQITNAILSGNEQMQGMAWPIISNEALFLENSTAIKLITDLLHFISSPDDQILKAAIQTGLYRLRNRSKEMLNINEILKSENNESHKRYLNSILKRKSLPLYELIESLIRELPTEVYEEQSVFIQSFLNLVTAFTSDQAPDLSLFLKWWDEYGVKQAVAVPEDQDAIKVMTIHKSKGLEFKAVIIPFCNWDLDSNKQDTILWCEPSVAPFNQLDLVPINYSSRLKETIFFQNYLNEKLHQYVDNINLLYVANTRAEDCLIAFGSKPKTKNFSIKTASDLLYNIFSNNIDQLGEWDNELMVYTLGEITHNVQNNENTSDIITKALKPFNTFPLGQRIAIKVNSEDFFTDESQLAHINQGKLMHGIFEKIIYHTDVEKAVNSALYEGKITMHEKDLLIEQLNSLITNPKVSDWYTKSYQVRTEATILGQYTYRPDRVISNDHKTIVIDYKFGLKESDRYLKQVKNYMWEIKKMGRKNTIEGYIWYVLLDKIVPVNIDFHQPTLF